TTYESVYLRQGKSINYISFSLPSSFRPVDWKETLREWAQETHPGPVAIALEADSRPGEVQTGSD
ncbi:MAG TPA: hypothetical protein VIR29_12910, partial [Anseongella sp.]